MIQTGRLGRGRSAASVIVVAAGMAVSAVAIGFAVFPLERRPVSEVKIPTLNASTTVNRARVLSPFEDSYAHALWPIHSELKLNAVRLTFAGINYATDDRDPQRLVGKVEPLTVGFDSAVARIQALQVPPSLRETHERYLEAATLYKAASLEMVKIAGTGDEHHLRAAHDMSLRAAENLLRVGEVLWPAEHKPH